VLDKKNIKEFGKSKNDTGSASVQIAHFTERINKINDHLKTMKKDHSSRRGLLNLVSKRRKLLKYLKINNLNEYIKITEKFNIRK
tara:strand:- start:346 stop:600 length:255 start_codon:yes stop_codon:yes gene_type:complete